MTEPMSEQDILKFERAVTCLAIELSESVWKSFMHEAEAVTVSHRLLARRLAEADRRARRPYPIQDGPSVPWEVMEPHEQQCQRNHSQSIQRIAERGGFGCAEAWAVVNGIRYMDIDVKLFKTKWIEFAERINLHYAKLDKLGADNAALRADLEKLKAELSTPEVLDFNKAVNLEAAHQRERWGVDHDAGKTDADWFWLVGYLVGKALHKSEKRLHHLITAAAALANWHLYTLGKTNMRPGIDGEQALKG